MIYLDNAATSCKKPEAVYRAADAALRTCSGNPGRSGHALSLAAGRVVEQARLSCARLLGAARAEEICFGSNATDALNLAIHGLVRPGSHVITSALEHNSVARPLHALRRQGVEVTVLPTSEQTGVRPEDVAAAIRKDTALVVLTHCSNVTGTLNDVAAVGAVCRAAGVPFLVDAAQSAGNRPIDVQKLNIDLLAFPGHKSLLGPQGTGGLYVRGGLTLEPLKQGGTGSFSELLDQPEHGPSRYESGTLNVPGLAGLSAAIDFLQETGVETVCARERQLTQRLLTGLWQIPGVRCFGPEPGAERGAVVSITIVGTEPQEAAMLLDSAFGIAVRAGLHCAPLAHRLLGTLEQGGTIRLSPNYFTTDEEIDRSLEAVEAIAKGELL